MKFQVLDIIPHLKNPVTGEIVSTADRLKTTTTPRPYSGSPRIWHGSATTLTSAALAARWGDPLFTANAIHPRENYKVLIDHSVAEGPALVGSPEQVIDKILSYHELYGHDLRSISLPTTLPFEEQLDILERFALEVVPAVRASAPTTLWESPDPFGGRPGSAGATEPDAASAVSTDHDNHRSHDAHVCAH